VVSQLRLVKERLRIDLLDDDDEQEEEEALMAIDSLMMKY
jgi:hypothetical protein